MSLIDAYDGALFDLDGVVYRGPDAIPAAPAALAELRRRGIRLGYVTNNAARSPEVVAEHLVRLGIEAEPSDIVTSAQAVAKLIRDAFDAGDPVFVAGTQALVDEIRAAGLRPVQSADEHPVAAVVGFDPGMIWDTLNEACYAVQGGAVWYGCNPDETRPTDRGLAIGLGAMLDAMAVTLPGQTPILAGKPFRPLLDETIRRLGIERPIFVGDRLDTDIEGADVVGLDSLFVLSGSHGPLDLFAAPAARRPTAVGWDISELLADVREVDVAGDRARCGRSEVAVEGTRMSVVTAGDPIDLVWAAAHLAWDGHDNDRPLDPSDVDGHFQEAARARSEASR